MQKNNGRDPSEGRDPLGVVRNLLNCIAANSKQIRSNSLQAIKSFEVGVLNMECLLVMNGGCHEHVKMIKILQVKLLYMAAMLMSKLC